ncbi:HAD-like protein [Cristinia sonorae]|uniref:HAD-like protein n=1 Tax=Cristinia sonorae TaxID=1940300 RepID=A0A8K0UYL3_9AGAR|nr:HAD-like protein [Cristinia sonorae]
MASPHLKAVIFDIGGVVLRSPLIAIAAYEKEHGIPPNYINCSMSVLSKIDHRVKWNSPHLHIICLCFRAKSVAWQQFERGEILLFPFYEAFGRELSNTSLGNALYAEYCRRRSIECPELPTQLDINGRELFGRMMRESGTYDERMVEAIRRIRATGKWRVIALTNNFSKTDATIIGSSPPPPTHEAYPGFSVESEMKFLGWEEGATPPKLRAMFDDFLDSSACGMRKPEPEFYLLACTRNGVKPQEAVFLDDLGMNLKAAERLGMETIQVAIGRSLEAIAQLEKKLGLDLTGGFEPAQRAPSKL